MWCSSVGIKQAGNRNLATTVDPPDDGEEKTWHTRHTVSIVHGA